MYGFSSTGVRMHLDGVGLLNDYSQVIVQSISNERGIWCEASRQANGIFWRLPNSVQISENNATYLEYGIKTVSSVSNTNGFGLGLFAINETALLMEGVYQCIAFDTPREGSFASANLWIVRGMKS